MFISFAFAQPTRGPVQVAMGPSNSQNVCTYRTDVSVGGALFSTVRCLSPPLACALWVWVWPKAAHSEVVACSPPRVHGESNSGNSRKQLDRNSYDTTKL